MCTRVDPHVDTDFIRRLWSGPLDPAIPKAQKGFSSRAIIDATKPLRVGQRLSQSTGGE